MQNGEILLKTKQSSSRVNFTHFIHSSFRQSRQCDTTSTDKFSLDRATSSLFSNVGPVESVKIQSVNFLKSSHVHCFLMFPGNLNMFMNKQAERKLVERQATAQGTNHLFFLLVSDMGGTCLNIFPTFKLTAALMWIKKKWPI